MGKERTIAREEGKERTIAREEGKERIIAREEWGRKEQWQERMGRKEQIHRIKRHDSNSYSYILIYDVIVSNINR